jgi:leader peptidase (prepilin peptidase)/N-methyltransferase
MTLLPVWFVAAFLLGLLAGGFVNFCARRLPFERSLLWPGPRCLKCCQPRPWLHCLPVLGYALSRGRCRACHQPTPLRDPIVELFTGVLFVGLFAVVAGVLPLLGQPRWDHHPDAAAGTAAIFCLHYGLLICFLLTASLCDLSDMEIPFSLTVCGMLVGLVMATLFPWPYPLAPGDPAAWRANVFGGRFPAASLYPWPVWDPNDLPRWLAPGSPLLGLVTGLAGAAAGTAILRAVGFLFKLARGIEGMGVGDADLMMMAGAFLGWQMTVVAFFVAVLPGLIFAVAHLIVRRSQALPFGPSLAVGVVLTVLLWPGLGNYVGPLFFFPKFLLAIFGGGTGLLLFLSFLLWLFRWLMGGEDDGGGRGPDRRDPVAVPTNPPAPAPTEGTK